MSSTHHSPAGDSPAENNSAGNNSAGNSVRAFHFDLDYTPHALASVLASFGNTQVITAVSYAEELPHWLHKH